MRYSYYHYIVLLFIFSKLSVKFNITLLWTLLSKFHSMRIYHTITLTTLYTRKYTHFYVYLDVKYFKIIQHTIETYSIFYRNN